MNLIMKLFKRNRDTQETRQMVKQSEKRKHPRWSVNASTFLYLSRRPPVQAQIIDMSMGGVRIEVREPLPVDSRAELALYSGGVVSKTTVQMKWGYRGKFGYVYGGEFTAIDPNQKARIMQYIKSTTSSN